MSFAFKKGDIVRTKGGRDRTVKKTDGRYVYFTDGSVYGLTHPDIIEVVPKKKAEKAEDKTEEEA